MALAPETLPIRAPKNTAQPLWNATPGITAIFCIAVATWLLVAIARAGWFQAWWIALPLLALAAIFASTAWWQSHRIDKAATLVILIAAALLYLPSAQQMALNGDAGIYGNEAAFLARTNSIQGPYTPLAPLSPETRDLFYIDGSEQFDGLYTMQAYDGIIYGGYYIVDPGSAQNAPTIRQSRMAQTSAWQALILRLIGTPWNFLLGFVAGCISLWLLYATGQRIAPAWIALWSTLVVAVSLPQVYLFRSALSEPLGQLWTLAGIYCAVLWLQQQGRQYRWYLPAALFFWITAWSARIDAALLAGPALLLMLEAARRQDGESLKLALAMLPPVALLAILGNNPPYLGATVEIFSRVQPIFLPGLGALLVAAPLLVFAFWRWGHPLTTFYQKRDWLWHLLLFLPAAFVILWSTIPNPLRVEGVTRSFQEIIWYSSASLTPLLYWLALAGIGLVLWKKPGPAQGFLALALTGLGAAYFLDYTSAPVYPVSLRRLVADVLPLLALLAGQAIALMPKSNTTVPASARAVLQGILVVGTLIWLGRQTIPILSMHEARDEVAYVASLNEQLPPDSVIIFEPQDENSWIGWLAAPLFSFHSRDALLLESDNPDLTLLGQAIREFEATGRTVLVASQSNPLPQTLVPPNAQVEQLLATQWSSSMIGQSPTPWPPTFWEFDLPVFVYRLSLTNTLSP